MTLSNSIKQAALAMTLLVLAGTATVQAQPLERSAWTYHGGAGSFARVNSPGQWVESTHLGTVYTFTETRRTFDLVELYDPARDLSVRLYSGACYIRHAGTNGQYHLLYAGTWAR